MKYPPYQAIALRSAETRRTQADLYCQHLSACLFNLGINWPGGKSFESFKAGTADCLHVLLSWLPHKAASFLLTGSWLCVKKLKKEKFEISLAISLDTEALTTLDNSANLRHLSREEPVREAVIQLARNDAWFRKDVEEGLEDIRNVRTIRDEQMNAESEALADTE